MPEKDKNNQEGPDVRGNLIKVNVGGDTILLILINISRKLNMLKN